MGLDFKKFTTGTLFLVRTPEVFPAGYAEESFADMKNMHFDYASWIETWNCEDGTIWKSNKFPRSSYWEGEERDPLEECYQAADKYEMAFLTEAGMMHREYMLANSDGMGTSYDGRIFRYGRIGLAPACPMTLEYLIEKYEDLISKFGAHPSFQGLCMPSENGARLSYDKYTRAAWKKAYGSELPSPDRMIADKDLEQRVFKFMEKCFLDMYCGLARHLKQKYNLQLMHYPLDKISCDSFFQPTSVFPNGNITVMNQVKELDLLNLQLHPPLHPDPYFFKMEAEFLMANAGGKPCMADTHFYHEYGAGRLPDTTPKRIVDSILSTVTPYGISFFCYGFMRKELPLWKKELNQGAPVYKVYDEPNTLKARREMAVKAMDYVEILRPLMDNTTHIADCAIYYPESLNYEYRYSSYPMEHIFGLHELFNASAVPVKLIDHIPENATEQKLVVMDSVKKLAEGEEKRLKNYLASGGRLVVIGKCCEEIERAAGLAVSPAEGDFIRSPESTDYNHCFIRLPLAGRHYTETNGEGLLYYNDMTPAVTKLGNVLFFGASDEIGRFSHYRDFKLVSWWKNYFTEEQLNSGVSFHNIYVNTRDKHQFVSCDLFANESKKLLLVRNYGVDQHTSTIDWTLPDNMQVQKAWADGKEFIFENGQTLPPFEHFVAIYAETDVQKR